jgi:anthranilate synthase component I
VRKQKLPHVSDVALLLALAARHPSRYPMLLQSSAQADGDITSNTRWSILGACNGETLSDGEQFFARLQRALDGSENDSGDRSNTPEVPRRFTELPMTELPMAEPPFLGGWMVYLGYELTNEIEPRVTAHRTAFDFPSAYAWRTPVAILFDHVDRCTWLVSESNADAQQIAQVLTDIDACVLQPLARHALDVAFAIEEDEPSRFIDGVLRIKEYLLAGDVFQVNLSRQWHARADQLIAPSAMFERLRLANPAPFSALVQFADAAINQVPYQAIISSSPERLVSVGIGDSRHGRVVQTRPIAGTRARSVDDQQIKQELITDIKERAEHIMLIDLERNDLGRVCIAGSVIVDELLSVESYAHVHHIVSNVRGRLREDVKATDVLRAVFPGGTITGCPKVRCMQIIAELEQTGRGPYTGAAGYIGVDGQMDFNILIRSFAQVGQDYYFRAGAGIVADSVPERELAETRAKAKGLLRALQAQTKPSA